MDGQWSWSTSKKKFRRITNYNLDCSHYNDVLDIQKQLQTMKTDLTGIITSGGPEALISLISSKKTWVDQQIRYNSLEVFYLNPIEQWLHFVEQLDQLEVCLPCSRLLTNQEFKI